MNIQLVHLYAAAGSLDVAAVLASVRLNRWTVRSRVLHSVKPPMVDCFRIITPLTHPDKACIRAFISPCSSEPHVKAPETEISKALFTQGLNPLLSSTGLTEHRGVKEGHDHSLLIKHQGGVQAV